MIDKRQMRFGVFVQARDRQRGIEIVGERVQHVHRGLAIIGGRTLQRFVEAIEFALGLAEFAVGAVRVMP